MTTIKKPGATLRHGAQSASARIVREVVRGLYEGSYAPGQRLGEPELMEQFGASRSTVRESIKRMEAEGVIDVLPHRGAFIRNLSPAEAIDALLVMEICAGLAARLAAERIERCNNRARFESVAAEVLRLSTGPLSFEFVKARSRFYRKITEISGNRELCRIVPGIHVHLIRSTYILPSNTRFEDYRRMVDAILAGDGAAAEAETRAHIAKTAALIRQSAEGANQRQTWEERNDRTDGALIQ